MGLNCKKQEMKYIFPQYKDALAKRVEKDMFFVLFVVNFPVEQEGNMEK